jgi:hypothetical protein
MWVLGNKYGEPVFTPENYYPIILDKNFGVKNFCHKNAPINMGLTPLLNVSNS